MTFDTVMLSEAKHLAPIAARAFIRAGCPLSSTTPLALSNAQSHDKPDPRFARNDRHLKD